MLVDCPYWVCHRHAEGIAGLDVSPNGRRLATCGTEPQVMLWNLLPILDPEAEADARVPKLLATLSEHRGSVFCVKFNHAGALLASGGNDNTVLLYRLAPGTATAKLGARGPANVENWRLAGGPLRGHALDVTCLAWTPDDGTLATGSMDGGIMLWAVTPDGHGSLVRSMRNQHNGWVKGLAFDPLGRYLASQGRNGTKVWDVQGGYACVTHLKAPFERTPEAGFKFRISWTPDGEVLLTVNASEAGRPTIAAFKRQSWELSHMVGHAGSVVAAAANPRLFHAPSRLVRARWKEARRVRAEAEGRAAGDAPPAADGERAEPGGDGGGDGGAPGGFEEQACMVLAAGSNDRTLTVWNSELPVPLLHVRQCFAGPVLDVCWTPDGFSLITSSNDDCVMVLRFAEDELGRAVNDAEFMELMRQEYGPEAAAALASAQQRRHSGGAAAGPPAAGAGAAGGMASAEDAELAALAADALGAAAPPAAPARPGGAPQPAPAAAAAGALVSVPAAAAAGAAAAARQPAAGTANMLERRLLPQGAGVTTGMLQQPQPQAATAAAAAASRKRLQPMPSGGGVAAAGPASKRPSLAGQQQQQQQQLGQASRQLAVRAGAGAPAGGSSGWVLEPAPVWSTLEVELARLAPLHGGELVALVAVATNAGDAGGGHVADVALHLDGQAVWRDKLREQLVALAGSAHFTAAATASGLLYTWRSGGNRMVAPLALGCPPASLRAQGDWHLLVVGADGRLLLLDLENFECDMGAPQQPNLAPILAAAGPGATLQDVWVTPSTAPPSAPGAVAAPAPRSHFAVLSDGSCWMRHDGMGLWMCLQPPAVGPGGALGLPRPRLGAAAGDGAVPGGLALSGDAERMRAAAAAASAAAGGEHAPLPLPGPGAEVWQRQEAEAQLFKALMLGDAAAYERWLGLLVTLLARQQELGRLKELAQDLLGPERWTAAWPPTLWPPVVLGLPKRSLLANVVVPTLARERCHLALQIQRSLEAAQAYAQQAGSGAAGAAPGPPPGLRLGPPAPSPAAAGPGASGSGDRQHQRRGGAPSLANGLAPAASDQAQQRAQDQQQAQQQPAEHQQQQQEGHLLKQRPPAPHRVVPVPVEQQEQQPRQHAGPLQPQEPQAALAGAAEAVSGGSRPPLAEQQQPVNLQLDKVGNGKPDKPGSRTPSLGSIGQTT